MMTKVSVARIRGSRREKYSGVEWRRRHKRQEVMGCRQDRWLLLGVAAMPRVMAAGKRRVRGDQVRARSKMMR